MEAIFLATQQYPEIDWLGGKFPYTMTYAHSPHLGHAILFISTLVFFFVRSRDCEKFLSLTDKKERHLTCVNTLR